MKNILFALLGMALLWTMGCEDDPERPSAPPPPPQITVESFRVLTNDPQHNLPDNEVFDIMVDSQNRVWISTDQGVAMKDGAADIVYFDDFSGIRNRKCRGLTELNGKIWVGTWGGGVAYYDGTLPWINLDVASNRVVDGQVFTLAADDSSVWIGTVNGITQYTDDPALPVAARYQTRIHNERLGTGIPERLVTSFVVRETPGGQHQVWVGKLGGGITVLPIPTGVATQLDPDNSGIPGGDVAAMAYDEARDRIWVAFDTNGLAYVEPQSSLWVTFGRVDGLDSELGKSVDVRSNGEVWYGTQRGVTRRQENGVFTNFIPGSGLPGQRVRVVYIEKSAAERVWLGFIEAGAGLVLSHE